jgi:hypothetical protein
LLRYAQEFWYRLYWADPRVTKSASFPVTEIFCTASLKRN